MEFKKYQHIERLGTTEVQNIELGECYVFPKLDGTNASVWKFEDQILAGSRNRLLTSDKDNAGFYEWSLKQDSIKSYLEENPTHRLFGEWLIPHSLNTYRGDAWKRFYVFDVCVDKHNDDILHDGDDELKHLHYNVYKPILEKHGIDFIPPLAIIRNGSYEQFINQLIKNVFLIEDGKGSGEGIVIKNYEFKNKYNRQTWAKIVTSEFKEKHAKTMGASEINGKKLVEEEIAIKYVTQALIYKEYAKIESLSGWSSQMIPRLLNTIFYCIIKEDSWEFIKEYKNPTIDFKRLQHFVFREIKMKKPDLF
jgi:hypothetical protein